MNPEELFEKLIKNEITREEFEALLDGFDSEEIRSRYDAYLESVFEKEMAAHFEAQEENVVKIDEKSDKKKSSQQSDEKVSGGKKRNQYPIAAIILLFIGTIFATLFSISIYSESSSSEELASVQPPELITKSTPNRRMFRMRLEDGSFVHLNAVSKITYPQVFAGDERKVEILGEAYFDVERDEQKPFSIKVKDYEVEVLGTSFNIRAYDDETDMSVAVESGTVRVDLHIDDLEPVILTKGQKLIFSEESREFKIIAVNTEDELSWRKGILKFHSTPMAQVEKMLERWYGVEVTIQNSKIYEYNFTGIHQNKNLKSVLETLTFATGTKYSINGKSVLINN